MLDQCGLADARLAGHPDNSPPAAARSIPGAVEPRERFRAADEGWELQRAVWRNFRASRRCGGYRGSGGNEAIASPRNRFDQARVPGIVVKRGPQIADGGLQHRVADELVAPYLIQQCVLGEQGCRLPHERAQHGKGRWRERDGLPVADQRRVRFVQLEPVEAYPNRDRRRRGASRSSPCRHSCACVPAAALRVCGWPV